MGLDMYLNAKRYMWFDETNLIEGVGAVFTDLPEGVKPTEVSFEVGYWRKANMIHRWFVRNVQNNVDDCQPYSVTREDLEDLLADCQMVVGNHETAEATLPTESGFFFGNIEYNEWYFEDVQNTIPIIERALSMPKDYYFEYRASW